jgi:hypothetical protein
MIMTCPIKRRNNMVMQLSKFLSDYIEHINNSNIALNEEEKQLRARLEEIAICRTNFSKKYQRAIKPPIDFGSRMPPICKICYLEEGSSIELTPAPSDNRMRKFKCPNCNALIEEV